MAGKRKQGVSAAVYVPEVAAIEPAGLVRAVVLLSLFIRLQDGILLPGGRVVKMGKIPYFSVDFALPYLMRDTLLKTLPSLCFRRFALPQTGQYSATIAQPISILYYWHSPEPHPSFAIIK